MSNTNNFVHELVVMAKAMEELPQVKAELDTARADNQLYLITIQRLELKLVDRANEIDALRQELRQVEAARDEAVLAFLEADDRTGKAMAFVRSLATNAQNLLDAALPANPEPTTPVAEFGSATTPEPVAPSVTSTNPEPVRAEFGRAAEGQVAEPELAPKAMEFPASAEIVTTQDAPLVNDGPFNGIDPTPEAAPQPDPIEAQTTSTTGTITETPDTNVTDPGYHNEPSDKWTKDWYDWTNRMDAKYGINLWPARDASPL